jgi:FdrA protein
MEIVSEIRAGAYYDSVVLMLLQRKLANLPGVDDAGVVMATKANKELLADFDLLVKEADNATADDLLIVVKADSLESAENALSKIDELFAQREIEISKDFRPHSLDAAVLQIPSADWVLISVPGKYAAAVSEQALKKNKHVFLYSDNVSIEDELKIKMMARERGKLVMGPDCGTAIINGIGLGFANKVRKGNIGVVAASGTGLQAVTTYLHNMGSGISQAIGTGGRDLKSEINGITALQSIKLLEQDSNTDVIVVVSKPPDNNVSNKLIKVCQKISKPVVINFIGYPIPGKVIGNIHFAINLYESSEIAKRLAEKKFDYEEREAIKTKYLRGLFSGGTLAYECMLGLQSFVTPLYSNVPINKPQAMKDPLTSEANTIVDLGEDIFTVGRLHPMMDNDLRIRRMRQEAEDNEVGMILLDVVLGEGAHEDPASELVPVIEEIKSSRPDIEFVMIVLGTDEDFQGKASQIDQFSETGAKIFEDMNELIRYLSNRFSGEELDDSVAVDLVSFQKPLAAINIGIETFYHSLQKQGAEVVQMDWKPPAGGKENLMDLLARMKDN